jgi:hypothetical protein
MRFRRLRDIASDGGGTRTLRHETWMAATGMVQRPTSRTVAASLSGTLRTGSCPYPRPRQSPAPFRALLSCSDNVHVRINRSMDQAMSLDSLELPGGLHNIALAKG